jgi:hypothetical protein
MSIEKFNWKFWTHQQEPVWVRQDRRWELTQAESHISTTLECAGGVPKNVSEAQRNYIAWHFARCNF